MPPLCFVYGCPKVASGLKVGRFGFFGAVTLKASAQALSIEFEGVEGGLIPPAFGTG